MASEYGFIYFLSNKSMPGIVKIGFTQNHPKARMDQLSGSTSCPTPFELLAAFGVENPRAIERDIHEEIDRFRVNRSREFLKVPPDHLLDLARDYGCGGTDLMLTYDLEMECFRHAHQEELRWKQNHFYSQCADPIDWASRKGGFK